jgi:hypothetical protein
VNRRKRLPERFPDADDRVQICAWGCNPNAVNEMLDRIVRGEEPPLTEKEQATWRQYRAGAFKRRRGEHYSLRRVLQSEQRGRLWGFLQVLKECLKTDPAERAFKRSHRGHYDLNERTAKKARRLLRGHGDLVGPLPSVARLKKVLREKQADSWPQDLFVIRRGRKYQLYTGRVIASFSSREEAEHFLTRMPD